MALTKLTSNLIEGGTGTDWVTAIQTSNFTAEAGKGYFVNTTSQVLYVNLPVGVVGMEITIQDYAGTFATNKVILNANGSEKIQGSAYEGRINTNNATAVLIYQDATKGWTSQDVELDLNTISWATPTGQSLTYSTPSPQSSQGATGVTFPTTTFTATKAGSTISGTATIAGLPSGITAAQTITGSGLGNTLTVTLTGTFPSTDSLNTALTLSGLTIATPFLVDYLVVAGGGGGAIGGGGAGGLRTSWPGGSGGGGNSESSLSLNIATNYNVAIGSGGSYGNNSSQASNGGNSSIAGSGLTTITSIGGGGGAHAPSAGSDGSIGGSGGGGGFGDTSATYDGGLGTANQGFRGGSGSRLGGGGGAGAGSTGGNRSGNNGGPGGNGLSLNISGTATYYAGGGGGVSWNAYNAPGGSGGGGNGGSSASTSGRTSGTANTGGGGGGAWQTGDNGGSGVVIIRYPNTKTITAGAGLTATTAAVGTDSVTTFTAGTGTITFS